MWWNCPSPSYCTGRRCSASRGQRTSPIHWSDRPIDWWTSTFACTQLVHTRHASVNEANLPECSTKSTKTKPNAASNAVCWARWLVIVLFLFEPKTRTIQISNDWRTLNRTNKKTSTPPKSTTNHRTTRSKFRSVQNQASSRELLLYSFTHAHSLTLFTGCSVHY